MVLSLSLGRIPTTHHYSEVLLTHWGRVTHICVSKLTIIGSDNGLSPGRRQAIIWTNPGILLIGPLGTNFSEILIGIQTFSFRKMHLKVSSAEWRLFCLGLNVLTHWSPWQTKILHMHKNNFVFKHALEDLWCDIQIIWLCICVNLAVSGIKGLNNVSSEHHKITMMVCDFWSLFMEQTEWHLKL